MATRRVTKQPEHLLQQRAGVGPSRPALATLPALTALVLTLATAGVVQAQTVTITPSVNTRLTWTDNVRASEASKQKDWIAEISPSIAINRESGRFSGGLNASLRNLAHAEDTDRNTTYLAFQGRGSFEAIEDALFFDAAGSISRNNTSAFSGRYTGDELSTDKADETRLWSFGPRFAFRFGGTGQGSLSYQQRILTGGSNTLGDQQVGVLSANIADPSAVRLFGWGLNYARTDTEYDDSANRDVTQEIGRGTLFVNIDPQFRLRAIAGYESNDYSVASGESGNIWGVGFDWYPTERTELSVTGEDRIFGNGYDVRLTHRMQRSVWNLTAKRDISSSLQELPGGFLLDDRFGSIFDNMDAIAESLGLGELTEEQRFQYAQAIYGALFGLDPIRSNAYFLQRSLGAGVTLTGVRNTVSLSMNRSERERLNTLSGFTASDDLSTFDTVKTRATTLSFNHRLSGLSSLTASFTRSKSEGSGETSDETKRTIASLGVSRTLSPMATGSLVYRYQKAEGASDYTENAITATLGMRF